MLHKRILAAATATFLALGMAVGGASPAMANGDTGVGDLPTSERKVWVCKYVGTPGVDERLQEAGPTQNNPIEVSVSTITDASFDAESGTGFFADGQFRSYAIGYSDARGDGQRDEPDISECPLPQPPTLGTASVSFDWVAPTCEVGTLVSTTAELLTNATVTSTDTSVAGQVTFVFAAADESVFSESEPPTFTDVTGAPTITSWVITGEGTVLTVVIALEPADAELCEDLEVVIPAITTIDTCLEQSYTITAVEGVTFVRTVDGVESEVDFAGSATVTYSAPSEGVILVTAVATDGYTLAEDYEPWTYTFTDGECTPTLGTASVTFDWTAATCELPATVTVNADLSANATLVAPDENTPAGTFVFQAGEDAQFSASEPPVFTSPAGAPTFTSVTLNEAKTLLTVVVAIPAQLTGVLCDDLTTMPLTEGMVTWKQPTCLGNGSFTLSNEPGIVWTVDGVVVEGNKTYTAAAGSTPTIMASLSDSTEYGFKPGQQTVWDLSFVAPTTCDLTTLALTGASNALGGLGMVAVLIMMAGTGLVVARRREAARIRG